MKQELGKSTFLKDIFKKSFLTYKNSLEEHDVWSMWSTWRSFDNFMLCCGVTESVSKLFGGSASNFRRKGQNKICTLKKNEAKALYEVPA